MKGELPLFPLFSHIDDFMKKVRVTFLPDNYMFAFRERKFQEKLDF